MVKSDKENIGGWGITQSFSNSYDYPTRNPFVL